MSVSALVTTAGGASSNAFVSVSVANQYHLDRPAVGTTWKDAFAEVKQAAILHATLLLDSQIDWTGWVVTTTQALLWPRSGMCYRNGSAVPTTVIPIELQRACAEFARQLMADDRAGDSPVETLGLTEFASGSIKLKFNESGSPRVIPRAVRALIPLDWGAMRGRTVELLRA